MEENTLEKVKDSFTLETLGKIDALKHFEEKYLVALGAAKIAEACRIAPAPGEKRPKTKYGYKVALRLELAHISLKKQLRDYERRAGLAPVCLDIFSRWYGYRSVAEEA